MKTLILALGNPILSDDGVAHEVADRIADHLQVAGEDDKTHARTRDIDITKSSAATIDIVPKLAEYDRLVVIDAVKFGTAPPGTVHRFSLADFTDTVRLSCPHDINFATAFRIAEQWGYDVPENICIYGIEVRELLKFSEGCTPEVAEKLDEITEQVLGDLMAN